MSDSDLVLLISPQARSHLAVSPESVTDSLTASDNVVERPGPGTCTPSEVAATGSDLPVWGGLVQSEGSTRVPTTNGL